MPRIPEDSRQAFLRDEQRLLRARHRMLLSGLPEDKKRRAEELFGELAVLLREAGGVPPPSRRTDDDHRRTNGTTNGKAKR